jgi:hypothetical protein
MPRGLAKVATLAKEAKARSDAYESGEGLNRALYLTDENPTARGRFLEEGEGIWYLYTHVLPKKQGQRYGDRVLCLDQPMTEAEVDTYQEGSKPCAGCELEGVSRPARVVINFIRYDEPKLRRDKDGKGVKDGNGNYIIDGTEPALVVVDFATGTGGTLSFLESQFGPLTNHVCTIHKTGDKNNPFLITVVEANKPVEEFEKKLHDKKTPPPEAVKSLFPRFKSIPLMSYGDMKRAYSGVSVGSGFQGGDGQPANGGDASSNHYAQAAEQAAGRGHLNLGAFGGGS